MLIQGTHHTDRYIGPKWVVMYVCFVYLFYTGSEHTALIDNNPNGRCTMCNWIIYYTYSKYNAHRSIGQNRYSMCPCGIYRTSPVYTPH